MSATEHSPEDPRIGLVLQGRYRIVKKLGSGGMGDVYEGVHELIAKKLAIKCLHADFSAHPEAVARFQREARAATAVGNEHIVDVSDIGELPDGSPFMVMEYLQGQELANIIDGEKISVERVIKIALEILEALQAAHKSGVVHRDMKPENVFLIRRGNNPDFVKVLDFGISMITENADAAMGRMTQTGVAMGTPNYMSPEQAKGDRNLDHRTDLYSLGVILYELFTGTVPFKAGTLAVLMTKILTETPASIRGTRPDVPAALDRIILRAMAKEPAIRYEDAEEFSDVLRPFLDPDYAADESALRENLGATVVLGARSADTPATTAELPSKGSRRDSESDDPDRTAFVPNFSAKESVEDAPVPAFSQATLQNAGLTSGKSRIRWIALVGSVAVVAVVFVVMQFGTSDEGSVPKSAVVAINLDAMVHAIPDAGTNAGATLPQTTEVLVKISVSPEEAQIFVNGSPFPNGQEVHQPRSTAPVRILVSLDGYKLQNGVTVFDRDRLLNYELEKLVVDDPKKRGGFGKNSGKRTKGDGDGKGLDSKTATGQGTAGDPNNNTVGEKPVEPDNTLPTGKFRETFD